jgi:hypothetical protein
MNSRAKQWAKFRISPLSSPLPSPAIPYAGPEGNVYDLLAIYDYLNHHYFDNEINAFVRWGKAPPKPKRPHNTLYYGRYEFSERLITIHRRLDSEEVIPRFVEFIMFHEMLHQKHPPRRIRGVRAWHTPEFRAEEKTFEDFDRIIQWECLNRNRLLIF